MRAARPVADWRKADDYAALSRGDRHAFAWEWLRRDRRYQETLSTDGRAAAPPERFGLHRLEPFETRYPSARPLWRREVDPGVLVAIARPSQDQGAFDLARWSALATCHLGPEGEHWLISDGARHVRLDVQKGSLASGPVGLEWRVFGLAEAVPAIAALQRLTGLVRHKRFLDGRSPRERKAERWTLALRVHDALLAGATQRQIVECLFDPGEMSRWRTERPFWRRRAQRLVEGARLHASLPPQRWLSVPP